MLPNTMAGKEFVFAPIKYTSTRTPLPAYPEFKMLDQRGDAVRIVALSNQTQVFRRTADGKPNVFVATLNKGEYYTDSSATLGAVYQTTEPALAFQYGKSFAKVLPPGMKQSGGIVQGHPTVESGMPCLQNIPSVDQWISNVVFSTMDGMDNFISMVFRASDSAAITVDNKSLSSWKIPVSNILNTPYALVSFAIGAGTHMISTTDGNATFMAWYNSSRDGLAMGRATGRALGVNFAQPGSDTINVKEGIPVVAPADCGTVSGSVSISGPTGLSMIYASASSNYSLDVEEFEQGAKTGVYTVNVIDKGLPASATVRIVTRTGSYAEKSYSYTPLRLTLKDSLGVITSSPRVKVCSSFTLKNTTTELITCRGIEVSGTDVSVAVETPMPINILPGTESEIRLCITSTSVVKRQHEVSALLDCTNQVLGRMLIDISNPSISTSDAIFGTVLPTSPPVSRVVEIRNQGTVDLLVDSLGLDKFSQQNYFTFDPATPPTFSGVIAPGETKTFNILYSPNGAEGNHSVTIPVHTNSTSADTLILCQARSSTNVGVDEDRDLSVGVVPHPVPISGSCAVSVPTNTAMRIIDLQGRSVAELSEQPGTLIHIQPSAYGMSAGTYLIVALAPRQYTVARIVVE
jgi:hypothetical protein